MSQRALFVGRRNSSLQHKMHLVWHMQVDQVVSCIDNCQCAGVGVPRDLNGCRKLVLPFDG